MVFFVGLGNPGEQYAFTRHNIGWMFLDHLAQEMTLPDFRDQKKHSAQITKNASVCMIKPTTYMNRSGEAVRKVIQFFDQQSLATSTMDNIVVVHDDLDIPFGSWKVQFGTGPKVHNGVNSIRSHLGGEQFWYVRLGIDDRGGDRQIPGHEYVLQPFTKIQRDQLSALFTEVTHHLSTLPCGKTIH